MSGHASNNGRVTPRGDRGRPAEREVSTLRRRSPVMYWVAVLVVVAMAAGIVASLVVSVL